MSIFDTSPMTLDITTCIKKSPLNLLYKLIVSDIWTTRNYLNEEVEVKTSIIYNLYRNAKTLDQDYFIVRRSPAEITFENIVTNSSVFNTVVEPWKAGSIKIAELLKEEMLQYYFNFAQVAYARGKNGITIVNINE